MAGTLQIKHGAKMRVAYDAPVGQEPKFNMVCTFNKAIDESAFLVSVPMVGGKALIPEDTQKMLFQYGEGDDAQIIAGYVDDTVKELNGKGIETEPVRLDDYTGKKMTFFHDPDGLPLEIHE